ncbi:hypothetical protein LCGC14_3041710 [marine sediment metagenome]|uniref:Uncharacterized protein n=1 Tax=marine sediment metagenome TaxID=412755 RepID=A0A0F8YXB8_9ZZZZ
MQRKWKPSTIVGTVLLGLGVVPALLWIADYTDLIRPGERPEEWGILVMSVALLGLGGLLVKSKGASIGEAFLGFFKRKSGGS